MKDIENFYEQSTELVEFFNKFIIENNLQEVVVVDHICFKCESNASFEVWRKVFEWEAKNFYQAIISKRRIALVLFKQNIKTVAGEIGYLELSDQKPDNSQLETFDHIEVFPKNKNQNAIEEILKILDEKKINYTKEVKPHITQYEISLGKYTLRLAGERLIDKIKKSEFV